MNKHSGTNWTIHNKKYLKCLDKTQMLFGESGKPLWELR